MAYSNEFKKKHITVIVAQDNTDYINWQVDILYESFLKVYNYKDNVNFLSLVCSDEKNLDFKYPHLIFPESISKEIFKKDKYLLYKRLFSLKEYVNQNTGAEDDMILLVDADFLFIREYSPIGLSAQKYHYMNYLLRPRAKMVIDFYLDQINPHFLDFQDYFRPVAWPVFIERNTLRRIIDRWIELTILLRTNPHPNNRLYKNWICDMYGFNLSLAELKIIPQVIDITGMPPFHSQENPYFYHYCYPLSIEISTNVKFFSSKDKIIFNKKTYRPWEPINLNEIDSLTDDSKRFLNTINNYITNRRLKS